MGNDIDYEKILNSMLDKLLAQETLEERTNIENNLLVPYIIGLAAGITTESIVDKILKLTEKEEKMLSNIRDKSKELENYVKQTNRKYLLTFTENAY